MNKRINIWLIPTVFCCILLLKMLIFSVHNWGLEARDPLSFHLMKLSAALFICSAAFFFKNKLWTIPFSFVFDFWIIANQVYLRSNNLCFDGYSSTLIQNLSGYGSGILGLFEWFDPLYVGISVLFSIFVLFFNGKKRRIKSPVAGIAVLAASIIIGWFGMLSLNRYVDKEVRCMNPFSSKMHEIFFFINDYCHSISLPHLLVYDLADVVRIKTDSMYDVDISFSEEEKSLLGQIFNPAAVADFETYRDTVVILLIESLENWAVNPDIMPNTSRFVTQEHVFYAPNLHPQIMAGTSSDGQFIINSGLLPIDRGAVCFTYPHQRYPSIASKADGKAITLIPHPDKVWNQKEMSVAQGYETTVQIGETDDIVFNSVLHAVQSGYQVVQSLTVSSHVPFSVGALYSHLQTPSSMYPLMSAYVKCMNYTDEKLDIIFRETCEGGLLHNATVIITGDHTIFYHDVRQRYARYCDREGLDYSVKDNVCPLIIYSPHIEGNYRNDELCWQMDIYPTVMNLLGNPDKSWKGLGKNLIGRDGKERCVSVDDAIVLGNKIIRNNIFSEIK